MIIQNYMKGDKHMNSTETNNNALDSTSLIEALAEDYECLFHVELNP